MKLILKRDRIRWFVLVIITTVSFVTVYIDQNIIPLLVTLFAWIFLSVVLGMQVQPVQSAHRLFLSRMVLATLLAMVGIGALNYIVNPFGLYPTHVFEPILLTTRDYKMNLYAAYSPPPQAVIIGSSRSFTVDPAQIEKLWHYSTFNASMTVGTLQEYIAFLRYISQVGKLPELLIINLAPEAFRWSDNNRYSIEPDARLWNYVDYKDP